MIHRSVPIAGLLAAIILAAPACSARIVGRAPLRAPAAPPRDFGLRFSYGVQARDVLDTFKGTYTWDMVSDPPVTIPFPLSAADRARIYKKIVEIGFLDYPDSFAPVQTGRGPVLVSPHPRYQIRVRAGGRTRLLVWDDTSAGMGSGYDAPSRRMYGLIHLITSIIESKPAYRHLPKPRGAYA